MNEKIRLDDYTDSQEVSTRTPSEPDALSLLSQAVGYELHQSAYGLAQTFALGDLVTKPEAPAEAQSTVGQHIQMLGRGVGSFIPTLAIGMASRYGMGRVLGASSGAAEELLLKRSALGLSAVEAGVTGLVSGALLKPTQEEKAQDWQSLASDRLLSGTSSALAFSAMALTSHALSRVADARPFTSTGLDRVLKSGPVSGMLSGGLGGFINVQADSLINQGTFSTDGATLRQSMYEMGVVGGLFGLTASGMARLSARMSPERPGGQGSELSMRLENIDWEHRLYESGAELTPSGKIIISEIGHSNYYEGSILKNLEKTPSGKFIYSSEPEMSLKKANLEAWGSKYDKYSSMMSEYFPEAHPAGAPRLSLEEWTAQHQNGLATLNKQFGAGSAVVAALEKLDSRDLPLLSPLADYIEQNPEQRGKTVETLIQNGAGAKELVPERLEALEKLTEHLGAGSDALVRSLQLEKSYDISYKLTDLASFIEKNPTANKALFEELVASNSSDLELKPDRLEALAQLKTHYSDNPSIADRLAAAAKDCPRNILSDLVTFIGAAPETRRQLVAKVVEDGVSIKKLESSRLQGLESLYQYLGEDSIVVKKLLAIETNANSIANLSSLGHFVGGDPEVNGRILAKLIQQGVEFKDLTEYNLKPVAVITEHFGEDSPTTNKLLEMKSTTPSYFWPKLPEFVEQDPGKHVPLIEKLVASDVNAWKLTFVQLEGIEKLSERFPVDSSVIKAAVSGRMEGLNQVHAFVEKSPQSRVKVLDTLAESGVDWWAFGSNSLEGFEELFHRLADHPNTIKQIVDSADSHFDPGQLAKYLGDKPENLATVLKILDLGGQNPDLTLERIKQFEVFFAQFPGDLDVLKNVVRLQQEGKDLTALSELLSEHHEEQIQLLRDAIVDPSTRFDLLETRSALDAFLQCYRLREHFRDGSLTVSKLLTAGSGRSGSQFLSDLAAFVGESPGDRAAMVERILASPPHGSLPMLLGAERLRHLERINAQFGRESRVGRYAERQGVSWIGELADFVDASPLKNFVLIDKLIRKDGNAELSEVLQQSALQVLRDQFGRRTMKEILKLEPEGLYLYELARFMQQDQKPRAALIQRLIDSGAKASQLSEEQLHGLVRLNAIFGEDSSTMQAISRTASQDFNLHKLADFIEHPPAAADAEKNAKIDSRKELVRGVAAEGPTTGNLDPERLSALESLQEQFAHEPLALKVVLEIEKAKADQHTKPEESWFSLVGLENFSQSRIGRAYLTEHANSNRPIEQLRSDNWNELISLDQSLQLDEAATKHLLQLEAKGLDVSSLHNFLIDHIKHFGLGDGPGQSESAHERPSRAEFLTALLKQGAGLDQLDGRRLNALYQLSERLGGENAVLKRVLELEPEGLSLTGLAEFASRHPSFHLSLIERLARDGAGANQLNGPRLSAFVSLRQSLNDEAFEQLLKLEQQGVSLVEVEKFLSYPANEATRSEILTNMLNENAAPEEFSSNRLLLRLILRQYFNQDQALFAKFTDLIERGLDLGRLNEFLSVERSSSLNELAITTRYAINAGASPQILNDSIFDLKDLINSVGLESEAARRVVELANNGVDISGLVYLIRNDSYTGLYAALIKRMLERGDAQEQLDVSSLRKRLAVSPLSAHFDDPELIAKLELLQGQRLSLSRLLHYLNEKPVERRDIVERLLANEADLPRFRDQLNLHMLPEPVAYQLAEAARSGGMSVPGVVGHLRNLKSGERFYDLLVEHVEAARPLAAAEIAKLADKAEHSGSNASPDIVARSASNQGYKSSSFETLKLAEILRTSANSIEAAIAPDKPIVLLGRDMGPVLPLLLADGRRAQYFLWTSLNNSGVTTVNQWLKEVPPNAAVVDTGYSGSIINRIKNYDATVSGYLLSTTGDRYPRLLSDKHHSDRVSKIEQMAKLIERPDRHTEFGGALVNKKEKKGAFVNKQTSEERRWSTEAQSRAILRAAGLTPWRAWRYSRFVGLIPQERLGLATVDAVKDHYQQVEEQRRAAATGGSANQ